MNSRVYVDPSRRGEWALALAALLPARITGDLVLGATEEDAEVDSGAHHLLVIGAQGEAPPGPWAPEDLTERILLGSAVSILVVREPFLS